METQVNSHIITGGFSVVCHQPLSCPSLLSQASSQASDACLKWSDFSRRSFSCHPLTENNCFWRTTLRKGLYHELREQSADQHKSGENCSSRWTDNKGSVQDGINNCDKEASRPLEQNHNNVWWCTGGGGASAEVDGWSSVVQNNQVDTRQSHMMTDRRHTLREKHRSEKRKKRL